MPRPAPLRTEKLCAVCSCLSNWMLLLMPIAKFGMGTAAYIIAVLLMSYRTLEIVPVSRFVAVAIGVMSMMTVVMTLVMLQLDFTPSFMRPRAPSR